MFDASSVIDDDALLSERINKAMEHTSRVIRGKIYESFQHWSKSTIEVLDSGRFKEELRGDAWESAPECPLEVILLAVRRGLNERASRIDSEQALHCRILQVLCCFECADSICRQFESEIAQAVIRRDRNPPNPPVFVILPSKARLVVGRLPGEQPARDFISIHYRFLVDPTWYPTSIK